MYRPLLTLWLVVLASTTGAQEAPTRREALARQRAEKSQRLRRYDPSRLERSVEWVEGGRVLQRIFQPTHGFFPRLGSLTTGSGFAAGPAYKHQDLFGRRATFVASTAVSHRAYWIAEAELGFPRLADGFVVARVYGRRRDYPQEDFFGLGADSRRQDRTTFALRDTMVGGSAAIVPASWLALGGELAYLRPRVGRGRDRRTPSVHDRFTDAQVPGLQRQPAFRQARAFVDLGTRDPARNPRSGGRALLSYTHFHDLDTQRFSFQRFEADLQQYVPFLHARRVIVLRGFASLSDAGPGRRVPFYLQGTLGGDDTLRGFREYRFRAENLLLLQAEYRFEIFPALDAALFYDAGKAVAHRRAFGLRRLEDNYGFGFRFGTRDGVFLRIDTAFGSRDGAHFYFRFNNVF